MARKCQLTGKKTDRGYTYSTRGISKKKKGIGLKITGKTKRRFKPNLVRKRLWDPVHKRFVSLRLSMAALRTIDKLGITAVLQELRKKGQNV
ncbi:MAG: 50S ribosomal protein L28 [Waddliaceae bacterium]